MDFIEILTSLIKQKKITKSQFLKDCGFGVNSFSNWKNSKSGHPSDVYLKKIADYFGVSTDYLLGRTDDPGQKTEPAPQNESKELELTQKELELINILRRTPPAQQEAVLNLLLSFSKGKE